MEEEIEKRKANELNAGYVSGKRPKLMENADVTVASSGEEEDNSMMEWLTLDDEAVAELSKFLDESATSSSMFKVRFIDDYYTWPAAVFQSSSAYVTINGNEESCGSSFSECESSVMANVDMVGMRKEVVGWYSSGEVNGGVWKSHSEEAGGSFGEGSGNGEWEGFLIKQMDGCDWLGCFDHHQKGVAHAYYDEADDDDDDDDDMWMKFLGEDDLSGSSL